MTVTTVAIRSRRTTAEVPTTSREGAAETYDVASPEGLRRALAAVDQRGWESREGTAVLTYARLRVVRPQVRRAGLHGPVAHQAEATGWALAWELLSSSAVRAAGSPWGVVCVAVRRAVLGEVVAAAYGTGVREAWRLAAGTAGPVRGGEGVAAVRRPVSLSVLDPDRCTAAERHRAEGIGPTLAVIADAMVRAGWSVHEAISVCEWVACRAPGHISAAGPAPTHAPAWRTLAKLLGIPPWRARRATVLLVGCGTWPGLVRQVALDGPVVLQRPDMLAAVRSTVVASHLSPAGAAQRAMRRRGLAAQRQQV